MVIKWTNSALLDLKSVSCVSKKEDVSKYASELFEYSQQLKQFPQLGHIYKYFKQIIVRRLIFQEHSILYYNDDDVIYIIAIIHHKQDINKKLKNIDLLLKK